MTLAIGAVHMVSDKIKSVYFVIFESICSLFVRLSLNLILFKPNIKCIGLHFWFNFDPTIF